MGILKTSLKNFLFTIMALVFVSCAQISYVVEQGMGQFKLLSKAKPNEDVLKNVRVPKDQKQKIEEIQRLKKYFYQYWNQKESRIYSETTFLDQDAVTYLVIASPYTEIKAHETCFAFMGCFPYLGFFKESSAREFADKMKKQEMVTWTRPVYAYSTLGYFNDSILSSFFHYDEYDLAELIFHELFHTIFFVKNEVDLNENLATYFAEGMLEDYFKEAGKEYYFLEMREKLKKHEIIKDAVVSKAREVRDLFLEKAPQTANEGKELLNNFLTEKFYPELEKKCQIIGIEKNKCRPITEDWNNARFSALLTYEDSANKLLELQNKLKLGLKDYYFYISSRYNDYVNESSRLSFEDYLFKKE